MDCKAVIYIVTLTRKISDSSNRYIQFAKMYLGRTG